MGLTYKSNKVCPKCGIGGYIRYMDNSEFVAKCTNCNHYFRKDDFTMCVLDKDVVTSVTNAECIRSMTDEDMAMYIFEAFKTLQSEKENGIVMRTDFYNWLKREAKK